MSRKQKIVIIGAGSEGRIALDALLEKGGQRSVVGFLDAFEPGAGAAKKLMGLPVLGGAGELSALRKKGVSGVVVALGDNARREELAQLAMDAGLQLVTVAHPAAVVARSAAIGPGSILHAGCVIGIGASLGRCVIVNTLASVDHDCVVGDFAQITPGAHLAGRVKVGRASFIGVGASLRQGIEIGERVVVGAGAAVVANVPDDATVGGVPARKLRRQAQT